MTAHSLITEGYVDSNFQLIMEGFHSSKPWITQILEELEKKSVGYTLIDYRYIEPGLADYTPMDGIIGRLEV